MFGAIPEISSSNSLKRRGPASKACTTSRVHRSPTRARASASGEAARSRVTDSCSLIDKRYLGGLTHSWLVVTCKLLLTTEVAMGALDGIQEEIQGVAERVGNAVVGIGQRWGVGSGVVMGKDQILTNAHNVRGDEVTVTFPDGHTATGRVLGHDVDGDIAVIGVETGDLEALEWATDGAPGIGAPVFALSNPGGRGLRVTLGFITGVERSFRGPRGRRITGSIEHDAPLLPGSSGGPIVTADGRLLGLNTHRLGEGFYLALPADESLRARVDALAKGEAKGRVRLG